MEFNHIQLINITLFLPFLSGFCLSSSYLNKLVLVLVASFFTMMEVFFKIEWPLWGLLLFLPDSESSMIESDPKPKFSLSYWFNTTFLLPKILYWLPYSDSFSDSWLFVDWCWIFYLDASKDSSFFFLSLFINFPSIELRDMLSNFDFLGPFFITY